MSRVSLGRRIDRIRDYLLPPGSLAWRIEQLSDADRAAWQISQERSAAIISRFENPGDAYAEYLSDPSLLLPIPPALDHALHPELAAIRAESDAAEAYRLMLEGMDR